MDGVTILFRGILIIHQWERLVTCLHYGNSVVQHTSDASVNASLVISNITNELEFNGLEIANIYRHRWDIESFFKLIKQNLTVKHLLGCSENAVKTHLWIAICSYLLLARIKAMYDSLYSITEIGTLVRVFALVKTDLQKRPTSSRCRAFLF